MARLSLINCFSWECPKRIIGTCATPMLCCDYATNCTFARKSGQDVLDRATQLEIAEAWGYRGSEGVLPVEEFHAVILESAQNVRYAAAFFADDAKSRPLYRQVLERVFSKRSDTDPAMGPTHIWVTDVIFRSLPAAPESASLDGSGEPSSSADRAWHVTGTAMKDRDQRPRIRCR